METTVVRIGGSVKGTEPQPCRSDGRPEPVPTHVPAPQHDCGCVNYIPRLTRVYQMHTSGSRVNKKILRRIKILKNSIVL